MREVDVERHLLQGVRDRGGMCVKMIPVVSGIPDRLVILPGQPMAFVELKRPKGGKVSAIQIEQHRRLAALGHPVAVLLNKEEVNQWLESR